jgi:hypothetical protein
VTEIQVAQGTYAPDRDEAGGVTPGDRAATFQLLNGVAIKGGFAGIGAPDPDARDIDLYVTVLTGDLLGDDGPPPHGNEENSLHVVTGDKTDATAALDGVTVTAGNADLAPETEGAGIHVSGGSPTVSACTVVGNAAAVRGGGMQNYASDPTLTDCLFEGNTATWGGGMLNIGGAHPQITGCTFRGNSASGNGGGLINLSGSHADVVGCVFTANVAEFGGGAVISESNVTFDGCTFGGPDPEDGNVATASGGGLYNYALSTTASVIGCAFVNNTAAFAGGMFNDMADTFVLDCTFTGNSAVTASGAMGNFEGASPIVTGCTFTANTSMFGGAMRNYDAAAPILTGCRFEGNTAGVLGGGIWDGAPWLFNCVVWSNTSGQIETTAGIVWYCDVQGGHTGTGNIDADPLFVDPGSGNYRLQAGSPCVDAASNDFVPDGVIEDLDGQPRFVDDPGAPDCPQAPGACGDPPIVDMGAYEFQVPCPWDLDGSGDVGVTDFLDLLAQWGSDPGGPPDFDGDGDVGVTDFLVLLANWGPCP